MPLNLTKANQEKLLADAMSLTRSTGWKDDAVAFAARRDGAENPCAIAVFQDFTGGEAEMHYATTAPHMTRDVVDAFKAIAFHPRFLGLRKLWIPVAASNKAAQRAALGAGFDFEYRKRGGMPWGEDAIILALTPDEAGMAAAMGPKRNAA
jgi:RimJ/RimL family protein N-acetyltransferase